METGGIKTCVVTGDWVAEEILCDVATLTECTLRGQFGNYNNKTFHPTREQRKRTHRLFRSIFKMCILVPRIFSISTGNFKVTITKNNIRL